MNEELPPNEPKTLTEYLWRIRHYEHAIYLKSTNADGKMEDVSLSELDPKSWAEAVACWWEHIEGGTPEIITEDDAQTNP